MKDELDFVVVNIGRNTANGPLAKPRWLGYIDRVRYCMNAEPVGQAIGSSQYNGQKEQFATFHFLVNPEDHALNRDNLAILARYYGQESIAYLISNNDSLVYASTPLDTYL